MVVEIMEYNAIYSDGSFEKLDIKTQLHRGGAAGKIYETSKPGFVAKIFHQKSKSSTNRAKLEAMLHNRPNLPPVEENGRHYTQIAWPEALLEDDEGFCVGYIMPLIDMSQAVSLDHLMQKAVRKKLDLPEKYAYRIFAAYNVASMVTALHSRGHYIVDLKPSNVSVYKDNMFVAMVDCDGFSIKGENGRYPAEFVSEEYIYPEGMDLACDVMGEEQDKFALAVIIFRLLNNGIHPFSGTPRKSDSEMLSIQQRIEEYHYAYGLWPDTYQAPNPYSIVDYFDKKTLELFENAFVKGHKRPSAKDWQSHLWQLLQNLKICKKNHDHVYFTSKGCGLCIAEQKFEENMQGLKIKRDTPKTLRGVEVSKLSVESVERDKFEKNETLKKNRNIIMGGIATYMIFFAVLFSILARYGDDLRSLGLGIQAIVIALVMIGINTIIHKYDSMPFLNNRAMTQMLQVYGFICMMIAFVAINELPKDLFKLSEL